MLDLMLNELDAKQVKTNVEGVFDITLCFTRTVYTKVRIVKKCHILLANLNDN